MSDDAPNPYLDREDDIDVNLSGRLPHWNQREKMQFVTFRLADSLPHERVEEIKRKREDFERRHARPWSREVIKEYHSTITATEDRLLDNGYGGCLLGEPVYRQILSDALRYYDNRLYTLLAYVIMPNHVHLLIVPSGGFTVGQIVGRIKSYVARRIIKKTRSSGPIWMREYYDRLIRSEEHLRYVVHYIIANPRYLNTDQYELYVAP